jgi:hypothetical protein
MRIKGSLARGVLVALGLALIPSTAVSAENVTPTGACKVVNQKVVYQEKTFTCTKSGKKLLWNKGAVVVKPTADSTPVSTADSTPVSISTSTPVTSSTLEAESIGATCSRNKNSLKNC